VIAVGAATTTTAAAAAATVTAVDTYNTQHSTKSGSGKCGGYYISHRLLEFFVYFSLSRVFTS
jgi:hypothetical protein